MAEGKKSFVAYSDWKEMFDALPNEDAGKLIKHIFSYVNDESPKSDSVLINAVFANIKSTLKRDLKKWEKQLSQRSEAGKKSAEQRALNASQRNPTSVDERARNPTVSDSVSVNVNENNNNKGFISDVADLISQENWCNTMCLKHGIKTHDNLRLWIQMFNTHIITIEATHKNEKEYKKHLNSWQQKQTINKTSGSKLQTSYE